jgi:hypothetical protein
LRLDALERHFVVSIEVEPTHTVWTIALSTGADKILLLEPNKGEVVIPVASKVPAVWKANHKPVWGRLIQDDNPGEGDLEAAALLAGWLSVGLSEQPDRGR